MRLFWLRKLILSQITEAQYIQGLTRSHFLLSWKRRIEDLLLSFLHLVCLLAVEILVSEALRGQLSHLYILLSDHHVCPHVCSEELRQHVVEDSDASCSS